MFIKFKAFLFVSLLLLVSGTAFAAPAFAGDMDGSGQDEAAVDFGSTYGIFVYYNNSTWEKLHPLSPEFAAMADMDGSGRDDLIVDFGPTYGTFVYYNNSTWARLHNLSPELMATGDLDGNGQGDVVLDFGSTWGTFVFYNNSTWEKLHSLSPDTFAIGDLDGSGKDDIIVDFGILYGTYVRYNDSLWRKLHGLSPEAFTVGDLNGGGRDDLVVDFGPVYGTYIYYDDSSWTKLHNLSPELMVIGDLDGNGLDDVVLDFTGYGTFIYYNDSTWVKLHSLSPALMAIGDLDGNGLDDVVLDFTGYGTFVYYNDSTWAKLHSLSPEFALSRGAGGDTRLPEFAGLTLTKVAEGFSRPTHIAAAGDGSGRLFVVERGGRIRIINNGVVSATPFLDITSLVQMSGGDQGLLSVAFPPGYSNKGYFYVCYTGTAGNGDSVVARYSISDDPDVADPASEEVLLTVDQPFSTHNIGQLAFGPDGYLYIGSGDGGGGSGANAQNAGTFLGKLLRIDTEGSPGDDPYLVPTDNPFVGVSGYLPEIWALGLRNPWRFSFDRLSGDLYVADVGQGSYEEVDFQPASSPGGENYGWNIMEGSHCFGSETCDRTGLALPVAEYAHSSGNCSVTGGMVYRGGGFPRIEGLYLFGDYCTGRVWGLRRNENSWEASLLLDSPYSISTFGEDDEGNLYLADYSGGGIYLISAQ